ncbi:MAG: bifunctional oligoribonuclease/PAP phosphatase NrnA, partial [Alistipes sp.]|nr:bifunctional oligoribonuclease/PAP phosphatase NrnA [Alistipes sp.]
MEIQQADIEQLKGWLKERPMKIVTVSHTNPDGDAIGSSLAWAEVLRQLGHTVTSIVPNRHPYFL